MGAFDLKTYLAERQALINQELITEVPDISPPAPRLFESMSYSLNAGGKRLRPILVLASWEACRGEDAKLDYPPDVMAAACALEMIHTYSLIHDDLPAMDDDDLRRGKPTNHKVFGDAMAILAGDALLTEAFARLASVETSHPHRLLKVVSQIAEASGAHGMAGGQVLDLQAEGKDLAPEELEKLHRHKTGRLIQVACIAGGELAEGNSSQLAGLDTYGRCIGLAFQIADDVLDVEEGTEQLGKTAGADVAHNKSTYPSVLGVEASKKKATSLIEEAIAALKVFDKRAPALEAIAHYIIERRS